MSYFFYVFFLHISLPSENAAVLNIYCSRTSGVVLKSTKVFDLGGRGAGRGQRRATKAFSRRLGESRDVGLGEEDFFSFM